MISRALFAGALLAGAPPAQPGPGCKPLLAATARTISGMGPVELTARVDCDAYGEARAALARDGGADALVGVLGDRRAAVVRKGPGGSGRYWSWAIAVEQGAGATIGACGETSTVGFRTIYQYPHPDWTVLTDGGLVLWTSVQADEKGGSMATYVVLPVVYRAARSRLIVDLARTREEVGRWGDAYAGAADAGDRALSGVHHAAAQAFAAYAGGGQCR